MSDKSLGSMIAALGLIGAVFYLYWLFAPASVDNILFYCTWINIRWAIVLPIAGAVLAIFFIAIWIGWTMAVTPPPTILEEEIEAKTDNHKEKV